MKLVLKNIGKIESAAVDINGITVIAGENDTGKSTVGRTLFAMFRAFYNIQEEIQRERQGSVRRLISSWSHGLISPAGLYELMKYIQGENTLSVEEIQKAILKSIREQDIDESVVHEIVDVETEGTVKFFPGEFKNVSVLPEDDVSKLAERIKEALDIPQDAILDSVVKRALFAEFNNQICNIYSNDLSEIRLQIQEKTITVIASPENVISVQNPQELYTSAVYLDDPFILDEVYGDFRYVSRSRSSFIYTHRGHLIDLLRNEDEEDLLHTILTEKRFKTIYDKVNSVCGGEVAHVGAAGFSYKTAYSDQEINAKNLSTGLKTFYILKRLLMNGSIQENGTIILDEPEIHLHPEWQILFAELIVLLHKEFHMHILLNTHSPYFLRAIETFAAKHKVDDQCKYYLSERADMGACISDVTGCVDKIYAKLAQPLQEIENLGWSE